MRNKELRMVVDTFKYYYKSITKNESYRFKMSDGRMSLIMKFIGQMKAETNATIIQKDYLKKFMEFQFNYWYKQDNKYGQGTGIQIEWIIGSKAWKRWNDRSDKYKKATEYIVRKQLKKDVVLKLDSKSNEGFKDSMLSVKKYEEHEKKLFFNTAKGLVNCMINTTLYHHKSNWCLECKNKMKCKRELKNQWPIVYKLRGY